MRRYAKEALVQKEIKKIPLKVLHFGQTVEQKLASVIHVQVKICLPDLKQ